jgi:hypothetical protein
VRAMMLAVTVLAIRMSIERSSQTKFVGRSRPEAWLHSRTGSIGNDQRAPEDGQ